MNYGGRPVTRGSSRAALMSTDWTTVRGASSVTSVIQSPEGWLETSGHNDATFFIEVAEVTNPVAGTNGFVFLQLESSPTPDESLFYTVAGPLVCVAGSSPVVLKTTGSSGMPLARYVRWHVSANVAGAWDVTFRIRMHCNPTSYFAPTQLGNLQAWYRADRGLVVSVRPSTSRSAPRKSARA